MKKQRTTKRLQLSKNTLRRLQEAELNGQVNGGTNSVNICQTFHPTRCPGPIGTGC